jgi:hypothetical protein
VTDLARESDDVITVVMPPAIVPSFKAWLSLKDLHLAGPIVSERDGAEPFYIVGLGANGEAA